MSIQRSSVTAFLRRGLIVTAFNAVIAVGLSFGSGSGLAVQLVYALAIGWSVWLFVDLGRFAFVRDPQSGWPRGWKRAALLALAIPCGYLLGTVIGDAYCGCSTFERMAQSLRATLSYVFVGLVCSTGICYFFYTQGRGQRLEQLAATAQRNAAENQLKLLASQLEPHMLFNTLANLRALIEVDAPRAQAMLDHLVAFLRTTLSGSRHTLHPLSTEFAHLADYLALMRVRMGERLQTQLDLPEALADLPVPALLLQPLVENAIKHGLEPHVQGGRLEVNALREGQHLVLSVRDDGAGLSPAAAAHDGTGFGLAQVRERLHTLYGPEATLWLRTPDDGTGGTLALVRIPLNRSTGAAS